MNNNTTTLDQQSDAGWNQIGLTLIELMIVLAVAGILGALAIPQVKDFLLRGRVAEGLAVAQEAKVIVMRNAMNGSSDLASGFAPIRQPAKATLVKSITVSESGTGEITVRYGAEVGDGVITLVPFTGAPEKPQPIKAGQQASGPISWACKASGGLRPEHMPASCN